MKLLKTKRTTTGFLVVDKVTESPTELTPVGLFAISNKPSLFRIPICGDKTRRQNYRYAYKGVEKLIARHNRAVVRLLRAKETRNLARTQKASALVLRIKPVSSDEN